MLRKAWDQVFPAEIVLGICVCKYLVISNRFVAKTMFILLAEVEIIP